MHCQLCGYEFDAAKMACHTACPLGSRCAIICCPNCGYQVVDESRSRLARLLRKWWKSPPADAQSLNLDLDDGSLHNCLLSQAPLGVEVEVQRLAQMPAPRLARLSVFGLIPGSRVTVLQHQPVPVLSIGETELSLSRDFLDQIWVQSPQGASALN
jgi:Fe2+ transport system protein FeoA